MKAIAKNPVNGTTHRFRDLRETISKITNYLLLQSPVGETLKVINIDPEFDHYRVNWWKSSSTGMTIVRSKVFRLDGFKDAQPVLTDITR